MPSSVFNYAVTPDSRTIVFVTSELAGMRNTPVIYSIQEDGRRLTRITAGQGGGDNDGGGRGRGGFGGFGGGIGDLNIARDGRTLWRRNLPEGGISAPARWQGTLVVGTTRYGIFLFSPLDGAVIDGIDTGSGVAMTPAAFGRRAFVVTNGGWFLGLDIDTPRPPKG